MQSTLRIVFRRVAVGMRDGDATYSPSPIRSSTLIDDSKRLDARLVAELTRSSHTRRYPAQTILIHEGDTSQSVFVVLEGRLRVFASSDDGKQVVINVHGPGEIVGELALDSGPRSASVMTLEACLCAVVTMDNLRSMVIAHPDFALHLIHKLIGRIRHATERMKSLALEDVYARLVRLIMESSDALPDGTRRVRDSMTQQEMAERIGSSREMVSRVVKDLTLGGYIATRDRRLQVLKALPARW